MNWKLPFSTLSCALVLAGCANVPPDAGQNPRDPYEAFNRHVYAFNDGLDRAVLKPVAEGYRAVTPETMREGVSNACDNLFEINNMANNLMQGKVRDGVESGLRFLVNTTFGIGGLFDVAGWIGMPRHQEDFGQTLAVWGVGEGHYLVLPLFGPSSTRDVWRLPVGAALNPTTYLLADQDYWVSLGVTGVTVIDARTRVLDGEEALRASTLDEYVALREAYFGYRRQQIFGDDASPEQQLEGLTPLNLEEDE